MSNPTLPSTDPTVNNPNRLLTAEGLIQEVFNDTVSLRWVRLRTKDGSLPHLRLGGRVFFRAQDVIAAASLRNGRRARR